MGKFFRKANSFVKDLLLVSRFGILLVPFRFLFRFLANFSLLTSWVNTHYRKTPYSDFYRPFRRYTDRVKLHEYIIRQFGLDQKPIQYLEFGVAGGTSFAWWVKSNHHPESRFHGFDTFEGLPEDWHFFKKGAFSFDIPFMDDARGTFIKGLFQNTLYQFLRDWGAKTDQSAFTRVLHMDADLYSSTLFALTSLAPFLREGDIILFDEFNIPNHEFAAWNDFTRSYYIRYEVLGAANNFYATAIRITRSPQAGI
ncbi:MAG TPA: class I SAM-dependent methyltransferase [Puia sp.]|nr:class I SAM-dependent methyltransferase [Puia sp.]